jgi:hypothetical protein
MQENIKSSVAAQQLLVNKDKREKEGNEYNSSL